MVESAGKYVFEKGETPPQRITLLERPLLRWSNPVAEEDDAALFVWTDRGRPAIYEVTALLDGNYFMRTYLLPDEK